MLLADTSVWVGHLRKGDPKLAALLQAGQVVCHPFIIGELACGHIQHRREILSLLAALAMLHKVEDDELLHFIDGHRLMGCGLGLIDMHLLASCLLAGISLWTRDAKLENAAGKLGLTMVSR